jgi:hypothetical protein
MADKPKPKSAFDGANAPAQARSAFDPEDVITPASGSAFAAEDLVTPTKSAFDPADVIAAPAQAGEQPVNPNDRRQAPWARAFPQDASGAAVAGPPAKDVYTDYLQWKFDHLPTYEKAFIQDHGDPPWQASPDLRHQAQ